MIMDERNYLGLNRFKYEGENGCVGLCDESKMCLTPCIYDSIFVFNEEYKLAIVIKNKKRGLIDVNGNEIVKCIYENVHYIKGPYKLIAVENKTYKWGLIGEKGNEITRCIYRDIIGFEDSDHLITVTKHNSSDSLLFGLVDKDGKEILPWIYRMISGKNGLICAQRDSDRKWGAIDMNNNVIIPFIYSWLGHTIEEGVLCYAKEKGFLSWKSLKYGLMTIKGVKLTEAIYDGIYADWKNGFAKFKKGDIVGYINREGKEVNMPNDNPFGKINIVSDNDTI